MIKAEFIDTQIRIAMHQLENEVDLALCFEKQS